MKTINYVFIFLACVLVVPYQGSYDFYHHKWAIILLLGAIVVAVDIYKFTDITWGLLTFWMLASGIYVFMWHSNHYEGVSPEGRMNLGYFSSIATVCITMVYLIVRNIKQRSMEGMFNFFGLLCLIDSVYVLGQWAMGYGFLWRSGFFGNGSINGCFIAFTYPILISYMFKNYTKKVSIPVLLIPIISVFCTMTSMSVGTLTVCLVVFLFFSIQNKAVRVLAPILAFIGILAVGYFTDPMHFFDDSARFKAYGIFLRSFIDNSPLSIGTGTGTFPLFAVMAQKANDFFVGQWFVWMHSDWLQYLTENGLVGFIFALCATFSLLRVCWGRSALCASVIGYMAAMTFNYPWHYPVHALFGVFLIRYAYEIKKEYRLPLQ